MSSLPFTSAPDEAEQTSKVVDFPSRLAKRAAGAGPKHEAFDVRAALSNMLLPDPPREALCEALARAGYQVARQQLVHRIIRAYQSDVLTVTSIESGRTVFLVHIVPEILDVNNDAYQPEVSYLEQFFPAGASLTILSEGVDAPVGAYRKIFGTWRAGRVPPTIAEFVSWRQLSELQEQDFPLDDLVSELYVGDPPDVGGVPAAGGALPPTSSVSDRSQEIANILEAQATPFPGASSKDYFDSLIVRLDSPWSNQLQGLSGSDPRMASLALVKWAIRKGELPGRPGTTLIGVLMAELSEDVGAQEKERLLDLIEEHDLLPVAEIARLRQP